MSAVHGRFTITRELPQAPVSLATIVLEPANGSLLDRLARSLEG
jgi:hypothetical protein